MLDFIFEVKLCSSTHAIRQKKRQICTQIEQSKLDALKHIMKVISFLLNLKLKTNLNLHYIMRNVYVPECSF